MNLFTLSSNVIVTRRNIIFDLFDENATKIREAVFDEKNGLIWSYRNDAASGNIADKNNHKF